MNGIAKWAPSPNPSKTKGRCKVYMVLPRNWPTKQPQTVLRVQVERSGHSQLQAQQGAIYSLKRTSKLIGALKINNGETRTKALYLQNFQLSLTY